MLIFHFMDVKVIILARIMKNRSTSFSLLIAYAFTTNGCINGIFSILLLPFLKKLLSFAQFRLTQNKNTCIIFCNEKKKTIHVYDTQICYQEFCLDFSFKASIYFAAF